MTSTWLTVNFVEHQPSQRHFATYIVLQRREFTACAVSIWYAQNCSVETVPLVQISTVDEVVLDRLRQVRFALIPGMYLGIAIDLGQQHPSLGLLRFNQAIWQKRI